MPTCAAGRTLAPVRNPSSRPTIRSVPVCRSAITTPWLPRRRASEARALVTARLGETDAPVARLSNSSELTRLADGTCRAAGRADAATTEMTETVSTAASAAMVRRRRAPTWAERLMG